MLKGRFATSVLAIGTLFLFTNLEMAYADDVAWVTSHADGPCPLADGSGPGSGGGGGGGGCGGLFGWVHCAAQFVSGATHEVGQVLSYAQTAANGFLLGLAFAIGGVLLVSALWATSPIWGAVVGLALAGYAAYRIYGDVTSWHQMTLRQRIATVSNLVGGVVGGFGTGAFLAGAEGTAADQGAAEAASGTSGGTGSAAAAAGDSVLPVLNIGSGPHPIPGAINLDVGLFYRAGNPLVDLQGDATRLPFRSGSIGRVVGTRLPSPLVGFRASEVAGEVYRVLAPGGTVRLTLVHAGFDPGPWIAAGFRDVEVRSPPGGGTVLTAVK